MRIKNLTIRIAKWTATSVVVLLIIPLILMGLLYLPPIQNRVVQKATRIASEKTGMDISIDRVRLTFLLDLKLDELTILQSGDTLLYTEAVIVDLDFSRILSKQLGVEEVSIRKGVVDTGELLTQLRINGRLGLLSVGREDTDLNTSLAQLSTARLEDCSVEICMRDTTIADTTESTPLPWTIKIGQADILNSSVDFRMPDDSLRVQTSIKRAFFLGGNILLGDAAYMMDSIGVEVDSLLLCVKGCAGSTGSIAWPRTELAVGGFWMDSIGVDLRGFALRMANSEGNYEQGSNMDGSVHLDFDAFSPGSQGRFALQLKTLLTKENILSVAQDFLPSDLKAVFPEQPLLAVLHTEGNIDSLHIDSIRLRMPTVANVAAKGYVADALVEGGMRANVGLEAKTGNLNCLRRYLQLSGVALPPMSLKAQATVEGERYATDAMLRSGKGLVNLKAKMDVGNMAYEALCSAKGLNLRSFLPESSFGSLSMRARLKGHGSDIFSKATGLKGEVDLLGLEYNDILIDKARLAILLKSGTARAEVWCDNDLFAANACASVGIGKENSEADFSLSLNKIDFGALGLSEDSLVLSMMLALDGGTDMKQTHRLKGSVHSMELLTKDSVFYPLDLNIELNTDEESMMARANAGNLWLKLHSKEGQDSLLYKLSALSSELERQLKARSLNTEVLRSMLPRTESHLLCGNNNPVANFLKSLLGTGINEMAFDLTTDPVTGINGKGYMNKIRTAAVLIDSVSWSIDQKPEGLKLLSRIKNGPRNKVVNFESVAHAQISPQSLEAGFLFKDGNNKVGVDFGVKVEANDSNMVLSLTTENPILAYRKFQVNHDNFVALDSAMHIRADLNLLADDGTLLKLYSTENPTTEQDVTLSVSNFNLGELSRVMPFMPMVTGMLNGDVHAVVEQQQATFSMDMKVKRMTYEGSPLGDVGTEVVYFPNEDGSHLVNGVLSQNNREIALLNGKYWTEDDKGQIEAEAELLRLPLNIANGFISGGLARMEGYITGVLDVKGSSDAPLVSGALATDSMHICSDAYSIDLTIPDDTIVIRENYLDIDRIVAYANGENPLTLDGTLDFRKMEEPKMDIGVVARDFNLINAPKRKEAEAYGKVYVDLFGRMRGSLSNLDIRGQLNVNGKTNVTYVMKDSPMIVDDELSSMVTFTDFSDTTEEESTLLPEQNVKLDFQVNIDEATTIHCLMNEAGQDKIDIEGGGELRLTYDPMSGMRLFGRYTVLSGRMDYSLVVVSLKNFQIDSGSYIEFQGDLTDPKLSISASERKKASVSSGKVSRSVNFDVGLNITQSLSNLGLEFTLKAPEDITVQNEISSMSVEDRGRTAVAMLTTGMYLSPNSSGGGGSFDATSALNSFLNSQISNIAGKALSTIDVGFGIDNTKSATGAEQTDYNFSFAKRFWGNRISVIIGGKVSSGNEAKNTGMSIINNVSVEYRLDNSGTRYVKAFYNKDTESILDAEVMEMGASLVLRRKTANLGELFIFRDSKKKKTGQEQ